MHAREKGAELPAEFRLVAACCMWPPTERRRAAIEHAILDRIDWDNVLEIVERQRVAGLVNDGLRRSGIELPPATMSRLAAQAEIVARHSLALASEALLLQAAFDAAGLPAAFIKGTPLALLAYGNIAIKQAWDIDLLVAPGDIRRACEILAAAGFQRTMPPASMADDHFFAWMEFAHECLFHNVARGTYVELHWRLSYNKALLADIAAESASRRVVVSPGRSLRTLTDEDLFPYLCLHGAQHAWSRLKWLADLAAWLSGKPAQDVERMYRKAEADGVGRAAAQALLLCAQLFALPLPPALAAELNSDRATRWLVAIALSAMADAGSRQTEDRLFGNLQITISHFLLATSMRHWLGELHSKSIGWTDFQRFALPRPLYFLYPMLRVPSWIWRRASHILGRPRQPAG